MAASVTLFISPHLDDAVFSCGGYIHRLASAGGKVAIVTVVTADDVGEQAPSWMAKRYIQGWRLGANPFASRCEEDNAAARVLGVEAIHLGFLDAIHRRGPDGGPLYTKTITGVPVHAHDWEVFEPAVREALGRLKERYANSRVVMVCPLGIGEHVDHQIVRRAVEAVSEARDRVYYEDFPYSTQADGPGKGVAGGPPQTGGLRPVVAALSPAEADARQRAMACYTSQIPGCFPSKKDIIVEILRARLPFIGNRLKYLPDLPTSLARMNSRMQTYIARVGGERYWLHVDVPDHEIMGA